MTTQAQAIHRFMSGFDIPAYASTAVPSDVDYPYLTYELVLGSWGDGDVNMTVNIWYRTESESEPNAKAKQIADVVGLGGVMVSSDNGGVWIKKGNPFCQTIEAGANDELVKRRYINLSLEFV